MVKCKRSIKIAMWNSFATCKTCARRATWISVSYPALQNGSLNYSALGFLFFCGTGKTAHVSEKLKLYDNLILITKSIIQAQTHDEDILSRHISACCRLEFHPSVLSQLGFSSSNKVIHRNEQSQTT